MKTERNKTDECKEFEDYFHPWGKAIISRLVPKKFEKNLQIADVIPVLADRLRSVTSQCKISPGNTMASDNNSCSYEKKYKGWKKAGKRIMRHGGRNKCWAVVGGAMMTKIDMTE